jgi:predicted DNA-binding mobile mystery protein A
MTNIRKKHLVLQQVDKKIEPLTHLREITVPSKGWINAIRTALGMTMRQLADRIGKKAQNIQAFEKNEAAGTITLQSLHEIAEALDLKLIYGLVPKKGTLQDIIDHKAETKAREIVDRTNTTMSLEDQANTPERLKQAYKTKINELKTEMPKFLWD